MGNKKEKEKEIKQWNLQKMKGFDKLNEGERKICNILKIAPNDYKFVEQQITKRVYLHGLIGRDKVPQQLYINIDDIKNVKDSITMRIGLVDPQILTNKLVIKK